MKIKNREQFLIFLTLGVLALYVCDLLVFEPTLKWWKSREATIAELRQDVKQGRLLIRRGEVIQGEWDNIRTNALPNDPSQAEQQVLRAFDNWAGDSGVEINSITPQWESDQSDYSTLECRVDSHGDIGTLSRFLYEIENDPTPLRLESVELIANDDRGQDLTLGLQVSGFSLISAQR